MSYQLKGFDPSTQSATPLFPLGSVTFDEQGRRWIYGRANGALTAGYWCDMTTDGTYDFTHTTTTRCGTPGTNWKLLGIPHIAYTDNYYGWFFTGFGTFEAVIENNYAAGDVLYTTANAGLPGTDSSSFQIDGVKTIDAGVTATRVTIWAAGILTAGVAEAAD